MYRYNIVAAGDRLTALAVKEVIQKGGNAFDGAVAGVFAAYMAEPALTSPGGGGFLAALSAGEDEPLLYDFFVDSVPLRVEDPEFFPVEVDFGDEKQVFHIGMGSVAVPGVVAGLLRLHAQLGRLPLEEVLKPALRYAKEGVYLSPLQASFVRLLEKIFTATPYAREVFAPDGELINEKKPFKNHQYAAFLELLIAEGAKAFYAGDIADRIEELSVAHRGLIRKEDLLRYKTYGRKPLKVPFKGFDVYLNPPPSAGGILIAFTLLLLEKEEFDRFGSIKHVSRLVEALYTTNLFRRQQTDRLLLEGEKLVKLLGDPEILNRYRSLFKKRVSLWGNTTHLSVSDREGNVVSVTTTNGEGSGYTIPGYGVMLNNMLGEEDLNPHGFFKWPPYVRLPSMMCPTIVLKDGEPFIALGSAGSNRIRSAIVQVLINSLVFGMEPQEAIDKPRLHVEGEKLYFEPGFEGEVIETAKRVYGEGNVVLFREKNLFFGGVQAVSPPSGKGGGDPRRGGVVLVFP